QHQLIPPVVDHCGRVNGDTVKAGYYRQDLPNQLVGSDILVVSSVNAYTSVQKFEGEVQIPLLAYFPLQGGVGQAGRHQAHTALVLTAAGISAQVTIVADIIAPGSTKAASQFGEG